MTAEDTTLNAKADARPPGAVPPPDALIVLPVRSMVLFPEVVFPITIGRSLSVQAAQAAVREQRPVLIVMQKDPSVDEPGPGELHSVGTVANILRYVTAPDGAHHVICQGAQRVRITEWLPGYPYLVAKGLHVPEPQATTSEVEARFLVLKQQALGVLSLLPEAPQ